MPAKQTGGGAGSEYSRYDDGMFEEERNWRPWLVPCIIVVCLAVFVVEMFVNNCPRHVPSVDGRCIPGFLRRFSFQPLRENPLLGPSSSTLDKMGALEWFKVVHQHQGWRLVSCIWLHVGLVHLIVNMLSLLFVGIRLEQQFGFLRVGIIYLLSGFGGAVLSSLFLQNTISVGASGALFGLLGSMIAELITNWAIYSNKAAAILTLLFIILINLAIGILPHVDNFAHIGGLLTGFLLGFVLLQRPDFSWMEDIEIPTSSTSHSISKYSLTRQEVFCVLAVLLLIAGLTVSLVMLFMGKNGNDHCHWCHYLNCVPTSKWTCDAR